MRRDTLIVIDDSELDLAILNEIFKNIFKVKCLSNAKQAMNFITNNHRRICAILLDICLGKKGAGFSVLQQIQHSENIKHIPIILITSDSHENNVLNGIQHGAIDFLAKPVDPHFVQNRVCEKVKASWPAGETILDGVDEKAEKTSSFFSYVPNPLSIHEAEKISKEWIQQIELLCQYRQCFPLDKYKRIRNITLLLAKNYAKRNPDKLSFDNAILIGLASPFYDIGLIGLPDAIIANCENPEAPNQDLYLQHTELGRDFFNTNTQHPFLKYCSDIAYWHHKNYDGTGYPKTKGWVKIPISAQLVRTALRCDLYMQSFINDPACIKQMVTAISKESKSIISQEMYRTVLQAREELRELIDPSYFPTT